METTLHRELKRHYAGANGRIEVRVGPFRVDAVVQRGGQPEMIEIQYGPLSVLRDKIRQLSAKHRVRLVKPIVCRKRITRVAGKTNRAVGSRMSPLCGRLVSLFDELVFFTGTFPHPNLTLEVLLVDIEEFRRPARRRCRRGYIMVDQRLLGIPRWRAQRVAYVLRKAGAIVGVGKQRRAWLYRWSKGAARRDAA